MQLVIVESPAKAKTINKYLGRDFKVIASYGHIRDLPSKNGSVEPDNNFAMHYDIPAKSSKHVKAISDAVQNAEAIYLATDPDREGEAISWHIIEALKARRKLKKTLPVHRVVFHEITKKAVTEAINNPRAIDMNLVNAQQARRALDYLVGFTLSPVLWHKLPGSRSAGRVQSVALRLICERETGIEQFKSREYWSILLHLMNPAKEPFTAKLTHFNGKKLEQFDINNQAQAEEITAALQPLAYSVTDIEKKQVRRFPSAPFTTSSLQQEASRKLGFGAKKTMTVAQKLYEGVDVEGETVGLITYMRTDSVNISQDAITQTRNLVKNLYGTSYVPETPPTYQSKAKNAQEAHEAIRPTNMEHLPEKLERILEHDYYRLYKLIWERMMASQMEPAILNQVGVTIASKDGKAIARATGSTIHFDGFFRVYLEDTDDESAEKDDKDKLLPPLEKNNPLALNQVEPNQHFTQPPPRYTEASLVKKLEELGIGRPSTYASIISVLQDRNYVKLDKKRFIAEDRGRIVTAFLESYFTQYVEYDFTAHLEEELDNISNGQIEWRDVLKHFWKDFSKHVKDTEKYTIPEVIEKLSILLADYLFPKDAHGQVNDSCPSCSNGTLSLKLGKFGAFLGCSNYPECSYTKPLASLDEGSESEHNERSAEPKVLGKDPATGAEVTVRQGPYGWYVQLGEEEIIEPAAEPVAKKGKSKGAKKTKKPKTKKPRRTGIPKSMDPHALTFDEALSLLTLPREVGTHPETGKPIIANLGRFGPYLQHDGKYTSLKEDDVLTVGINRAVVLIDEKAKRSNNEPLRVLGTFPETTNDIAIYSGRYGPYIKYQKLNVKIPKGTNYETITLETAIELIKEKL